MISREHCQVQQICHGLVRDLERQIDQLSSFRVKDFEDAVEERLLDLAKPSRFLSSNNEVGGGITCHSGKSRNKDVGYNCESKLKKNIHSQVSFQSGHGYSGCLLSCCQLHLSIFHPKAIFDVESETTMVAALKTSGEKHPFNNSKNVSRTLGICWFLREVYFLYNTLCWCT